MMALIDTIKTAQLNARKSRDSANAASLTTLIGEAEAIGKAKGRAVTDSEVVTLTKKFLSNNRDTHKLSNAEQQAVLDSEHATYSGFLPKQMSQQEMELAVKNIIEELKTGGQAVQMGPVMSTLKERFEGLYDGKAASIFIKAHL